MRAEPRPAAAAHEPAMRVTCISHSAVSRTGGRLRYAPLLGRSDLTIDLVVPALWHEYARWRDADPPDERDVATHLSATRWANGGFATWHLHHYPELRRLLGDLHPQVIHLWEEPWSLVSLQATRLRNRLFPDAAIVLEVDQNIYKRLPQPFQAIRRYVLQQADYVLARSDHAIAVVRRCGYTGPAGLIGYGVDRAVFHPRDRAAARTAFGFHGFTVGYVGRLIPEKGLDDLLEAAALAEQPLNVAILGEGPHRAAIAAHAERRGLAGRVRLLPWCDPAEVAAFMSAVDVVALLTRTTSTVREQFGRVIIEAQACGVPVIGSSSGAIPHVVGRGGWIVPERAPSTLAALLDALASDPDAVADAAARGQGQVAERFSYDNVATALVAGWRIASQLRSAVLDAELGAAISPPTKS